MNDIRRLKKAFRRAVTGVRDERILGTLGRTNADGSVTVTAGRQNYVYVTMDNGTLIELPNTGSGHVPERAGLPVKMMRLHNGTLVLDGYDERLLEGDANLPGAHGVLPHASTHKHGGTDEVATVTPAAGAIPKADPDGYIGVGWLDPADLASGTVTSVNGQTGVVVLDPDDLDDSATTSKFTTAAEITKLAGIEALADVTDATNVAAAGAVMDSELIDTSAGAGDAGKPIKLDAGGQVDATMINDADISLDNVTEGSTNKFFTSTEKTKLAGIATGANLYVHPNHTGDVTSVADGATTIAADAVTFAKMQNIATDSLIGRDTASSGDPENITLGASLSMNGSGVLQRAALTGDVTASVNSNATAIGANKVLTAMIADAQITLAKMADLAQATIIGRASGAGTGVPTALTAAQVVAIIQASIDHGSIAGLGDDDHTQYALLAGRSGGQTLKGGTASGDDLTLESTNHATKGTVFINPNGGDAQIGKSGTVLIFGDGSGSAGANFNGAAGNVRDFVYQSAGSARWIFRVNATAESGSNAGSDLEINSRTDAGAALVTALTIARANGALDILGPVVINEAGADKDVRMEGDTNANLFFLDASVDGVGIGVAPTTRLGVQAGTSNNDAAVGGVLYVTTAQGANVGAGEDSLAAYTVPANTLAVNGQSLVFEASGTFAANGNNKRVCVRFGSTGTNLAFDMTAVAINGQDWSLRGTIIRTGAATQKAYSTLWRSTTIPYVQTGLNQTLSGAVTLTVFGEGVSNNDILLETFKVWWHDNNT